MSARTNITSSLLAFLFFASVFFAVGTVQAADTKVGIINVQKVLATCEAGKKAHEVREKKMEELQATFKKDEEALLALQKEIEKKSSAWSEEMKQEKAIEFQKKRRNLGVKQEDANLEMKTLRERQLAPILKQLETVVKDVAQKEGYALILPRNAVLHAVDSVDLTEMVTKALNKKVK
ncbi:MAG: hypothetical protein GQ559_07785 [Desulfobulbaceae bacterium]|nr:hypothetical protein [Desulfobulbaceae bacterium]